MTRNKMRPVSPGEVLREQLEELGMSANALAAALHVPTNRVTGILNGTRALLRTRRCGWSGSSPARRRSSG